MADSLTLREAVYIPPNTCSIPQPLVFSHVVSPAGSKCSRRMPALWMCKSPPTRPFEVVLPEA